ncbi:MAG: response regulator transcription factor [Candidatus Methylopumilus sp.]|nr:response regulator transcription factor [Candidatus Methylopumilus sp.]
MTSKTHLSSIRVALVDDDIGFQKAMRDAMAGTPDIALAEVAGTYALGLAMLSGPQVDVLIIDLGLPDGSGIDIIRAAHEQWPECNLMVSTTFGDELHVMQSLEAGASGYLLKDSAPQNLVHEIRSLHSGGSPISPLIARKILTRFQQETKKSISTDNPTSHKLLASLSSREQEVLEYITKGFSSNEIAGLMGVSPHTVLTFVRRIYAKLKVKSKTEAIYEARNQGLLG